MYNDLSYSKYRDRHERRKRREAKKRQFFRVMGLTVLVGMVLLAAIIIIMVHDRLMNFNRNPATIIAMPPPHGFAEPTADEVENGCAENEIIEYEPGQYYEPCMPPGYNPYHHNRVEVTKRLIGTFEITAYCSCVPCTGIWSRYHPDNIGNPNFVQRTASGTIPTAGRTVAVSTSLFYLGQEIYITGIGWRVAEDTGSAVTELVIDIYMGCHQAALNFGRQKRDVFTVR